MSGRSEAIVCVRDTVGGKSRCAVWPHLSLSIQQASVAGNLYDLGPYPAMVHGSGLVLGELHEIEEAEWESTLKVLDAFEEYNPAMPDASLYTRELVEVQLENSIVQAWHIFFKKVQPACATWSDVPFNRLKCRILGSRCASWSVHRAVRSE